MSEPEKKRGLAALTPERRREIARLGGMSVPREKRTFFINPEMAKRVGSVGGLKTPPDKRFFALNPLKAQEAGLKSASIRRAHAGIKKKEV